MRRLQILTSSTALFLLPFMASAQIADKADGGAFQSLLSNILVFTNGVLIPFIIGIGFLVFVWGMFQFFIAGGSNDEAKDKGKSLMIYATLGFVLIIVFWGIINLLTSSTGLDKETLQNTPTTATVPAGAAPAAPVAP
jgi:Type IV secretion system pilin